LPNAAYIGLVIRCFFMVGLALCCGFLGLKAQGLNAPGELPHAFKQSPKILVGLDSRRSFISNRDVKIMGLRVGLDFEKHARVGFGIYTLASPFSRTFIRPNQLGILDTLQCQLEFAYMTAYFEYVVLTTKHWEVSVPLHLGIGDVGFTLLPDPPKAFLLGEMSVQASYKIVPFLGLAGGFGYRQIFLGGYLIRENFDAPIYSFGIKFWTGYLIEKVLKKMKPPAQSS
jgi:hypothetical protein